MLFSRKALVPQAFDWVTLSKSTRHPPPTPRRTTNDQNTLQKLWTVLGESPPVRDLGIRVGILESRGGTPPNSYLFRVSLGTLGGSGSTAHWVNDAGDVVGGASTPNDQALHATLWRHRDLKITDLGAVAGRPCSLAHNINSERQIVGYSDDCNDAQKHAFLWEDGGRTPLSLPGLTCSCGWRPPLMIAESLAGKE